MFLPNELLSDISNFIPDDNVKNLTFLSRAFATVTAKRLPIINVKNKILVKVRHAQWPPIRTMIAKHNYDPRVQSPNADGDKYELSFSTGDKITICGEMDEDGFYFGGLKGCAVKLVPSNFLEPAGPNTTALLSPHAKAVIFLFYQFEFYPYTAAQNQSVPTKILSDISTFIPDDYVKKLTFVSRALAVHLMKKLPIIKAKNEVISKYAHVRIMIAKWDYDPRIHSPNDDGEQVELSFRKGDKITVYDEMDEDGFYLGELNGVRGLVPSNFLEPAGPNIMIAKYDYDSKLSPNADGEQVELSFCRGDKITIYGKMDEDGFCFGSLNGARGLVPSNFLEPAGPNTTDGNRIMMAIWDYDPRHQSLNVNGEQYELSFCKGDLITVYGEMNEDGFYFGDLYGVRGLVPSYFLHPTILSTPNALMPPQAKASTQSPARHSGPGNRKSTNNKTPASRSIGMALSEAPANIESAEATAPSKKMSQSSVHLRPEYPGEVCALMCFRRIFAKDESTENRLTEREKTVASNLYAPGMPDRIGYGRDNWETVSMGSSSRHKKFQEDVATVMMEPKHSKTVAAKHRSVKSNATADKPPVPMTREVSDSEIAVYLPPDIKKHSETGRIRKM